VLAAALTMFPLARPAKATWIETGGRNQLFGGTVSSSSSNANKPRTMNEKLKPKARLPGPTGMDMKPSSYQPGKAEMEEEIDMPGWSLDRVRAAFMRPFLKCGSKT